MPNHLQDGQRASSHGHGLSVPFSPSRDQHHSSPLLNIQGRHRVCHGLQSYALGVPEVPETTDVNMLKVCLSAVPTRYSSPRLDARGTGQVRSCHRDPMHRRMRAMSLAPRPCMFTKSPRRDIVCACVCQPRRGSASTIANLAATSRSIRQNLGSRGCTARPPAAPSRAQRPYPSPLPGVRRTRILRFRWAATTGNRKISYLYTTENSLLDRGVLRGRLGNQRGRRQTPECPKRQLDGPSGLSIPRSLASLGSGY